MRWRTGDKEKKKNRFLQYIPGIICAEQPERLRNSHTSCCLFMKTPTGRNNQSVRVNKPFSYQEIQRIKEDLGDYLEDPENILELLKVLLCFMTSLGRMWCISWNKRWLPTQRLEFWEKRLLMEMNGEGNGTPLKYSCLENPMDGGAR